jgi:fibronectin type 3 domain-containing protein
LGGSATITVTTQDGGKTATCAVTVYSLAAPASVTAASGGSTTQISVSWTAVTGATGYTVYRARSSADPSTAVKLTASPQTGTSFVDTKTTSLVYGSDYKYYIAAVNANGEGMRGNNSSYAYTMMPAPGAPTIVPGGSNPTMTTAWIQWPAVTDAYYNVYQQGSSMPVNGYNNPISGTSYTVTGLSSKMTYSFTVTAVGAWPQSEGPASPALSVTTK